MNKNYSLFYVFLLVTFQSIFAARLTIYNETPNVQDFTISAGGNWKKAHRVGPGQEVTINSGLYAFTSLIWGQPTDQSINTNAPKYTILYSAEIPSSRTMLMGSILLRQNGRYGINFDADGASDKKVRLLVGIPNR